MKLIINDMHCSHCADSIRSSLNKLDKNMAIEIDLETKLVALQTSFSTDEIVNTLNSIGFFDIKILLD